MIGFGKIGSIVADRGRGLKMRVIVYDPFVAPEQIEKAGFVSVTLAELYRRADYITVHVPKLKDTVGMINHEAFAQMKDGVMLINCARGGIVKEADLIEALNSGKVAGASLDVFETEPPGVCPLFDNRPGDLHPASGRLHPGGPDQRGRRCGPPDHRLPQIRHDSKRGQRAFGHRRASDQADPLSDAGRTHGGPSRPR